MPEPFVHLHLHSHYSLLDSAIKPYDLAHQVAQQEMPAVALTDHGNLHGAYEFYAAAKKAGVRPILGCEFYVAPGHRSERSGNPYGANKPYHHLVVLAETQEGWRNLMLLSTRAYLEGFYHKPRIDKELLNEHRHGLIALSACLSGEVPSRLLAGDREGALRAAQEYREILGPDNFFLEIQDHGLAEEAQVRAGMYELSAATGIPLVATNDCHFHRREDVEAHRVLIGIGQNKTLDQLRDEYAYNDEFYVKSAAEMAALFADRPDAVARTAEIAARCHVTWPEQEFHLPRFAVPEGEVPETYLAALASEGLRERLREGRPRRHERREYEQRLASELDIIHRMGFDGYFLVVWDFIRFARQQGIPVGPGRGSAAGSLVAYALRITDIDPLQFDLLFERFLNPERISMPDIDIDFCQRRRDEVIAHVRQRYGDDNVCQIATFNVLQARSCIRDVGRVLKLSYLETDRIAKAVPETLGVTLERALGESRPLAEMVASDPQVARVMDVGKRLEGLVRHCGVHAAGVVITPRPVRETVPLFRTSRDEVVTQFDKDVIEKLGLLKMDFLGLRTLTVVQDCQESIRRSGATPPDFAGLTFDDPDVYALFKRGDTDGVFQFESGGMRDLLRSVQPDRFEELVALNALYRPGPMAWAQDYADRKHGRQKITYELPELEEILAETYGIIVYQEQVMRIASRIADFTMAQADTLRKAMGKKIKELIDEQGERFIAGGVKKGYPESKVRKLWERIVPFAQYGFNKSHSVAYAYLAYQTAYLKTHFPKHFWAAMLSSETANSDKLATYIAALSAAGTRVLPPDVNASAVTFTVEGEAIRVGLEAVKGVGESAAAALVAARMAEGSFKSLAHLVRSLGDRSANRKVIESLVKAGALDTLHPNREGLLADIDRIIEQAHKQRQALQVGQGFLFDLDGSDDGPVAEEVANQAAPDLSARLHGEREALGFYLSGHPLDRWSRMLKELRVTSIAELPALLAEGCTRASVAGIVSALRVRQPKGESNPAKRMAMFHLEDQTGTVRAVMFARNFARFERLLADGAALLVSASLRSRDGGEHVEIEAEEIARLEGLERRRATALRVQVNLDRVHSQESLTRLHDLMLQHSGALPVTLRLCATGWEADLVPTRVVGVDPTSFIPAATAVLGPGQCEYVFGNGDNGREA